MRRHQYSSAICVLVVSLLISTNSVMAADTPTGSASCDQAAYTKSVVVSAKPVWQWVKMGNVYAKVPISAKWKIGAQKLAVKVGATNSVTKESTFSFGRVLVSAITDCSVDREYSVDIKIGSVYKPDFSPYDARVERIGNNVATIVTPKGDTDCPTEHAIIFRGKNIIDFSKTCSAIDTEARTIIGSFY